MAEKSPQDQVRELKDLVLDYAKQETVEPIKQLGAYIGWALAGAALLGIGIVFLAIGLLRFLQTSMPEALDGTGKSSWFPYFATIAALGIVAFVIVKKMTKPSEKDPQ